MYVAQTRDDLCSRVLFHLEYKDCRVFSKPNLFRCKNNQIHLSLLLMSQKRIDSNSLIPKSHTYTYLIFIKLSALVEPELTPTYERL
jgi:hypothetical protein